MLVQSPKALADFVRSNRVHSGMTQEELGVQAGMSRRWVQGLEAGSLVPSFEATIRVASAPGYELYLEPIPNASHLDDLFEEPFKRAPRGYADRSSAADARARKNVR